MQATAHGNPRMLRAEARETLEQIRTGLRDCRLLLLDLYEREGWRALGYASWRECCQAEFALSIRHLYRLLAAAQVERDVTQGSQDAAWAPIPERQLRDLARIDSAAMRKEIWAEAQACDGSPASRVKELVNRAVGGQAGALDLRLTAAPPALPDGCGAVALTATSPAAIAEQLRRKAAALRALHPQLGDRSRAADQALDRYLEVAAS